MNTLPEKKQQVKGSVPAFTATTIEAEAGGLQAGSQPGPHQSMGRTEQMSNPEARLWETAS